MKIGDAVAFRGRRAFIMSTAFDGFDGRMTIVVEQDAKQFPVAIEDLMQVADCPECNGTCNLICSCCGGTGATGCHPEDLGPFVVCRLCGGKGGFNCTHCNAEGDVITDDPVDEVEIAWDGRRFFRSLLFGGDVQAGDKFWSQIFGD